jgi:hypothetical protein
LIVRYIEAVFLDNKKFFVKVRQLFNNPNHRKLIARLLGTDLENIPNRF